MKTSAICLLLVSFVVSARSVPVSVDDGETTVKSTVVSTGSAMTVNPASGQTMSGATMPPATVTTESAPTVQPITSTTGSPLPVSLITMDHSTPATIVPIVTTLTPLPVQPTPAPKRGFDGASFGGGIALGIGICVIFLIVYKVYTAKRKGGYNTM